MSWIATAGKDTLTTFYILSRELKSQASISTRDKNALHERPDLLSSHIPKNIRKSIAAHHFAR